MQIYLDWFILMNSMHTYYIIHDTDNQKVLCSAWDHLSERKGWSVWKRRRKGLHIPKILRIKILLLKWSWILVRYACFEMGENITFYEEKNWYAAFSKNDQLLPDFQSKCAPSFPSSSPLLSEKDCLSWSPSRVIGFAICWWTYTQSGLLNSCSHNQGFKHTSVPSRMILHS